VAIRWSDFPHEEIFVDVYSRTNQNSAERSTDDSLRHILQRRLHLLNVGQHHQYI
jgi:hypothetical protein